MREFTRDELLALTPEIYLADGFVDGAGHPRPDLFADYASAAVAQLVTAEVAPQELAMTVEGLRQLVTLQEGDPVQRLDDAIDEVLGLMARILQQPNNKGLVAWISACADMVETQADLDAFLAHGQAVARQYALLLSLPQPGSQPS